MSINFYFNGSFLVVQQKEQKEQMEQMMNDE